MNNVAVVILNWNGRGIMSQFLPSVVRNMPPSGCKLVVADNGSTDGSVEYLRAKHPEVELIVFDKNYGFAEGYNKALSAVKAEYYLLLNSDVEWKDDVVTPLLRLLEADASIGVAMPKILSQREPDKFEYAGAAGGFIDKYGFPFCRGRVLGTVEHDRGQYDTRCDIFWASGAALFIRSSVFWEVGGLDTDFFAHMEEIDLCWRVRSRAHRIVCEPQSRVYHLGGASLDNSSPYKLFLNYRNSLYMLHKNASKYKSLIFKRMLIDGVLACVYLLSFKPSYFMAVLRAHKEYKKMRAVLDTKRSESCSTAEGIYPRFIILAYALGKKLFSDLKWNS